MTWQLLWNHCSEGDCYTIQQYISQRRDAKKQAFINQDIHTKYSIPEHRNHTEVISVIDKLN